MSLLATVTVHRERPRSERTCTCASAPCRSSCWASSRPRGEGHRNRSVGPALVINPLHNTGKNLATIPLLCSPLHREGPPLGQAASRAGSAGIIVTAPGWIHQPSNRQRAPDGGVLPDALTTQA